MATYSGVFKSSYFKVKDVEAFEQFVQQASCEDIITVHRHPNDPSHVFLCAYDDLPSTMQNGEDEDDEKEFLPELAKHLAEGEVAMFETVGYEKLRYLGAYAAVVLWDGRIGSACMEDLLKLAAQQIDVTLCPEQLP